ELSLEIELIRLRVLRRPAADAAFLLAAQAELQLIRDVARDLLRERDQARDRAGVFLAPEMTAIANIEELGRNAQLAPAFGHIAHQDGPDAHLSSSALRVHGLPLVLEDRIPSDDLELRKLREVVD